MATARARLKQEGRGGAESSETRKALYLDLSVLDEVDVFLWVIFPVDDGVDWKGYLLAAEQHYLQVPLGPPIKDLE